LLKYVSEKVYKVLVGKPKARRPLRKDQGRHRRMGLQWILGRLAGAKGVWSGFNWVRIEASGGQL
jgi:hypothetical protein